MMLATMLLLTLIVFLMNRVSLTSMVQICEQREEATPVRRTLYPRSSPAGQVRTFTYITFSPTFIYSDSFVFCV